MKRSNSLLAILSLTALFACVENDKITRNTSVLPTVSNQFIAEHFGDIPVSNIRIDREWVWWIDNYDVVLADGTNIEFNRKGEWKDVNRHNQPVPHTIIPAAISDFVRSSYPTSAVVVIERDLWDYEIKLDNGLEIKFDLKGNPIGFD